MSWFNASLRRWKYYMQANPGTINYSLGRDLFFAGLNGWGIMQYHRAQGRYK